MLTDKTCQKKATGKTQWISGSGIRGEGRLYLRISPTGVRNFYFRYTGSTGDRDNLPLGEYDPRGLAGCTLSEANDRARDLAKLYKSGVKDLRRHFERLQAEADEADQLQREAMQREAELARQGTVSALVTGYLEYLARKETRDLANIRGVLTNHLTEAFPDLCERKASSIKVVDLRPVLARLTDAGKGRTAAKLRSYIRAAYAAAIRAESDPTMPGSLLGFGLESNPADLLPALSQFNRPGDRTLSENELRAYMLAVDQLPARMTRDALMLSLLLGGQRPQQLLRVTAVDVDLGAKTITLRDEKGARDHPRLHVLPLPRGAEKVVADLLAINSKAPSLFSTDGQRSTRLETLSTAVREISQRLADSNHVRATFCLRDIRRTCETLLAGMRVSRDVRAQLQSHGLGGVQGRHYDRHDYLDEKWEVLHMWEQRLAEIRAGIPDKRKVVHLRRRIAGA